jgi:exodeoxyribonuclease V beta subunit
MSFDISSASETITQRLFVEASAGTGKTFVIEHYLVRSILTTSFNPKKLALITFTKAVARELRLRLRGTLQSTLDIILEQQEELSEGMPFKLDGSTDEPLAVSAKASRSVPKYLEDILAKDTFYRRKAARTIEESIERLGEAMITTIHGFCDALLKGWGEVSGDRFVEEWAGEEEKKKWLAEFLQEGARIPVWELEAIAREYTYDQNALISRLISLMDDADSLEDTAWEDAGKTIQLVREQIEAARVAEALGSKAKGYCGNMRKDGALKEEVIKPFEALQDLVENGITEKNIQPLLGFSLPRCFLKPLCKQPALAEEDNRIAIIVLEELWPVVQKLTDVDAIVKRLAMRSARAFMDYIISNGMKTPQLVIRRVFELSVDDHFLAYAAEAVEWLVIDEFQDTDAMQYAIFSRLFLNNPLWNGRVLFVGDPKQAIYGFRKADVYSYLAAKSTLLPNEIRTLSVNYRAEENVVEAQNRLFAGLQHPWIFYLPRTQQSLDVVPSKAGRKAQAPIDDGRGAIHLFIGRGRKGRSRSWPSLEIEQQQLFPWLADEMIALKAHGIQFRSQAVLVKDRYQAKRVQKYLNERSIPTCAWRVDNVTDSSIYEWLCQAFSLAVKPYDQRRLSALLLTMPTEYHLTLCHDMAADKRLDQWASCTMEWMAVKEAFQEGGIGAMARALLSCRWNGRDTLEEYLFSMLHGEELIIDLEHLFELLSLLEPVLPHSLEAYEAALTKITSYFSDDIEALTRRIDPDDQGVPILTMHRSKGLEFEVVFALGAANRTPLPDEGRSVDEADAEKLRQLYVAITRAKRRCYLPLLAEEEEKQVSFGQASPVELLFGALTVEGKLSSEWLSRLYQSMSGLSRLSAAAALSSAAPHLFSVSEASDNSQKFPSGLLDESSRDSIDCAIDGQLVRKDFSGAGMRTEVHHGMAKGPEESVLVSNGRSPAPLQWICRQYRSFSSGIPISEEKGGQEPFLVYGDTLPEMSVQGKDQPLLSGTDIHPTLFGRLFHEMIARLLFAHPEARESVESVREWLKGEGRDDEQMAELLYNAARVKLPLGGEEVSLEEVPRSDMRAECPFLDMEPPYSGAASNERGERYIRGVLDLVFLWNGAVYVVDWKTHEVGGGACKQVVEERYESQHKVYLQAVARSFTSEYRYGGFFFAFVRHLASGGIVGDCGGDNGC